ncbi:DUF916 and DUF3324 domain-containing protein [Lactiplantibacillus pentosus]|uniref:DUF916 and DUF3324 domain-containing protein n=1 Tax=Lactiplantibacillus pentosus TaxID=1589 RepID=UPI0021A88BA0|nr:DUF916 and DUF3324 domain-containing protein [Lactiplantibacillus pentosus]MCT3065006.1 DUF916 and DUF3324 domain-containing protein [Lactiplantibacillus pentosus]
MKKIFWQLMAVVAVIGAGWTMRAQADDLNYTVQADLPNNQINQKVSYFDLKVTPGQKQNLTLHIKNSDSKEHRYTVSPNLAVTNDNGIIDYSQANAKADDSLKFNIKTALSKKQVVTVPAKSSQAVTIQLNIPEKTFKGVALGGINIVQELSGKKQQVSSGMAINNQYAYVIGLQLQESDKTTIKPNMKLHSVKAEQRNYRNYVSANLQNDQPVIMHGLKIKSYVTKAGSSKKVLTTNKENMSMAPNSNFNFAIGDGNKQLKAGKYTLHLTATADKGKWQFTKNFTITDKTAKALNDTAVTEKQTNYFWWFVALGVVIIALLGAIIWLLLKNRRRQD